MRFLPTGSVWKETVALEWAKFHPKIANRCTIAIGLIVIAGYLLNQPAYGIVAAGGAFSIGFGVYQQFTAWRIAPMLFASIGMVLSTITGSLAGQSEWAYIVTATLWGLLPGIGFILGTGGWWICTQWIIALLVAASYPASLEAAFLRGLLVFAGGGAQIVLVGIVLPVREDLGLGEAPFETTLWHAFRGGLRLHKTWMFAMRGAAVTAIACVAYQRLHIPNGYWIAVTAIILLKPEFQETLTRSLARSAGTLLGAGLTTLLIALLKPGPESLLILVIAFTWFSYAFVRVNYALFALCITAYIVFMIGLAHLPTMQAVTHRIVATAIGAALAVFAHGIRFPSWDREAQSN